MGPWGSRGGPAPAPYDLQDELFDEAFVRRLEALALLARRIHAGRERAERRSRRTGTGVEFADHREYLPGDDLRHVDWNVWQRHGRLLLRTYEQHEDLSVHVVVDTSRSMSCGTPSRLDVARRLGAALSYIALSALDRLAIYAFDRGLVRHLAPGRGRGRIFAVLDAFRRMRAGGETDLQSSLRAFVAQRPRPGLVLLLSDLYDAEGLERGLDVLRHARFEPVVIHLIDPADERPALRGEVRLVDVEDGSGIDVTVTPALLERYERALRRWRERVRTTCLERQVRCHELAVTTPWDEAVVELLRRGVLGD
ncbi:MAG: DUF58 domain-containing protein [Myxococcota bacterium]|nr:DUF58 domain-containing protein [Myxococcota bacterium]MDW8363367.1 DUF58 domain-containing protein [Myxococcales bacterium]